MASSVEARLESKQEMGLLRLCFHSLTDLDSKSSGDSSKLVINEVIRAGTLQKLGGVSRNRWQKRYFALVAPGIAIYCESKEKFEEIARLELKDTPRDSTTSKALSSLKGIFSCEVQHVRHLEVDSTNSQKFSFVVELGTGRTYQLSCESDKERSEWMASFEQARSIFHTTNQRLIERGLSTSGDEPEFSKEHISVIEAIDRNPATSQDQRELKRKLESMKGGIFKSATLSTECNKTHFTPLTAVAAWMSAPRRFVHILSLVPRILQAFHDCEVNLDQLDGHRRGALHYFMLGAAYLPFNKRHNTASALMKWFHDHNYSLVVPDGANLTPLEVFHKADDFTFSSAYGVDTDCFRSFWEALDSYQVLVATHRNLIYYVLESKSLKESPQYRLELLEILLRFKVDPFRPGADVLAPAYSSLKTTIMPDEVKRNPMSPRSSIQPRGTGDLGHSPRPSAIADAIVFGSPNPRPSAPSHEGPNFNFGSADNLPGRAGDAEGNPEDDGPGADKAKPIAKPRHARPAHGRAITSISNFLWHSKLNSVTAPATVEDLYRMITTDSQASKLILRLIEHTESRTKISDFGSFDHGKSRSYCGIETFVQTLCKFKSFLLDEAKEVLFILSSPFCTDSDAKELDAISLEKHTRRKRLQLLEMDIELRLPVDPRNDEGLMNTYYKFKPRVFDTDRDLNKLKRWLKDVAFKGGRVNQLTTSQLWLLMEIISQPPRIVDENANALNILKYCNELQILLDSQLLSPAVGERRWSCVGFLLKLPYIQDTVQTPGPRGELMSAIESVLHHALLQRHLIRDDAFRSVLIQLFTSPSDVSEREECFARALKNFLNPQDIDSLQALILEILQVLTPAETLLPFRCLITCCSDPETESFSWVCSILALLLPHTKQVSDLNLSDLQEFVADRWQLPIGLVGPYIRDSCFYTPSFISSARYLLSTDVAQANILLVLDCVARSNEGAQNKLAVSSKTEEKLEEPGMLQRRPSLLRAVSGSSTHSTSGALSNKFVVLCFDLLSRHPAVAEAMLKMLRERTRLCSLSIFEMIDVIQTAKSHPIFGSPVLFEALKSLQRPPQNPMLTSLVDDFLRVCKEMLASDPSEATLLLGFVQSMEAQGSPAKYIRNVTKPNLINSCQEYESKRHTLLTLFASLSSRFNMAEIPDLLCAFKDVRVDFNLPNGDGQTALHILLTNRQFRTAALMITNGADPSVQSREGVGALDLFWSQAVGAVGGLLQEDFKRLALAIFDPAKLKALPHLLQALATSLSQALSQNSDSFSPFTEDLLRNQGSAPDVARTVIFLEVFILAFCHAEAHAQYALLDVVKAHLRKLPQQQRSLLEQKIVAKWNIIALDLQALRDIDGFWTVGYLNLYRDQIKARYSPEYRVSISKIIFYCSNAYPMLNQRSGGTSDSQTTLNVLMSAFQACITKYSSGNAALMEVLMRHLEGVQVLTVQQITEIFMGLSACTLRMNSPIVEKVREIFKLPAEEWPGKFFNLESVLLHATFAGIKPELVRDNFLEDNSNPALKDIIAQAFKLYQEILATAGDDVESFSRQFEVTAKTKLAELRGLIQADAISRNNPQRPLSPSDHVIVKTFSLIRKLFIEHRKDVKQNPHHTQMLNLLIVALLLRESGKFPNVVSLTGTGQGKSLTIALLSAYLVLLKPAAHDVMVTDFLAQRGIEDFKQFFAALELPNGVIKANQINGVRTGTISQYIQARGERYTSLFGALPDSKDDEASNSIDFPKILVVDEVDTLVVDSGGGILNSSLFGTLDSIGWIYKVIADAVKQLRSENDTKSVIERDQRFLDLPAEVQHYVLVRLGAYFRSARAASLKVEGNSYAVIRGQIKVLDPATGNPLDVVWTDGLHQFLQLKHNLPVSSECLTAYSISYEQFFKEYSSIVGFTGTLGLKPEQQEIEQVYAMLAFKVPLFTKPHEMLRHPPEICSTEQQWLKVLAKTAREFVDKQIPTLLIVDTLALARQVLDSVREACSNAGYTVQSLTGEENATQRDTVIRQAGQVILDKGCLTIGSLFAARGIDFRVTDDDVDRRGGMLVLMGTFFDSFRVEVQAEGRTRRQDRKGQVKYVLATPHLSKFRVEPFRNDPVAFLERLRSARESQVTEEIAARQKERVLSSIYHDTCQNFFRMLEQRRHLGTIRDEHLSKLKLQWCVWYDLFRFQADLVNPRVEVLKTLFKLDFAAQSALQQSLGNPRSVAKILFEHFCAHSLIGSASN